MPIESHSETWKLVKRTADKGIELAAARLETSGHPIDKTEFERGKIKAYREILALASAPTPIPE